MHHSTENYCAKTSFWRTGCIYLTCLHGKHAWPKTHWNNMLSVIQRQYFRRPNCVHRWCSFLWCARCFREVSTLTIQKYSGEAVSFRKSENRQKYWLWQLQWKKDTSTLLSVVKQQPQKASVGQLQCKALLGKPHFTNRRNTEYASYVVWGQGETVTVYHRW